MAPGVAFVSFLLLLAGGAAVPVRAAEMFDQERCSLCHIRQSVFFDGQFIPREKSREFGEERMCMSCHDGTVRDNRATLWRGAQHPAPPTKDGRTCSRCHSPHSKGGGWEVLAGTAISLRKGGNAVCAHCHGEKEFTVSAIHAKKAPDVGCGECHRAHGGVGKALLKEATLALCRRCHGGIAGEEGGGHPMGGAAADAGDEAVRKVPANGKSFIRDCTMCHPPHAKGGVDNVWASRCVGCHMELTESGAGESVVHRDVSKCLSCHVFHKSASADGRAFRGRMVQPDLLCGTCHPGRIARSRTDERDRGTHVTQAGALKGSVGAICLKCHKIHKGSPGSPLLRSKKEHTCLACHEDQNTIRETSGISLAHPVFERVEKGRLSGIPSLKGRPLGASGEIACRTCHPVHGAAQGTALLPKGTGKAEICFWCHEGYRGVTHGASGAEDCSICHVVHGRKGMKDNPWKDVCGSCHPRQSHHPLGADDRINRRPRDLPLFDAHGRANAFGGLSCPTCHEVHGKGRYEHRLRRPYAASAFLCTACHNREESVALTPHDLRGIRGRSICEPCHLPHGGKKVWMSGLEGEGTGEDACRSCHREGGIGFPVSKNGHVNDVIVARPLPGMFPLFGSERRKEKIGVMICSTCHDVHGTGITPVAGKGAQKLLRKPERICQECHEGYGERHGEAGCMRCHPPHGAGKPMEQCGACHKNRKDVGAAAVHMTDGRNCDGCHRIHARKETRPGPEARCLECHPKTARIGGTPHGKLGDRLCMPCHPAHAKRKIEAPVRKAWEEVFAPDLVCLTCHKGGSGAKLPKWTEHPKNRREIATSYGAKVIEESPVMMVGRLMEEGRPLFPLFDGNGMRSLAGRLGCLSCHDAHAGSSGKAADGADPAGKYLRDPSYVFLSEICTPCHSGEGADRARKFHEIDRATE